MEPDTVRRKNKIDCSYRNWYNGRNSNAYEEREEMIWTVSAILNWTAEHFKKQHFPTPRLDAEVLLAHLLKTDRVGVYTRYDQPLSEDERRDFREMVKRRIKREPVAYITGHKEFFSLDFLVEPGVLIPRPETEILVEMALELRSGFAKEISILDLGTGSGNIAITLAHRLPADKLTACDISPDAVRIARENARRLGVGSVEFLQGDLFKPVRGRRFDIIISNPPYVSLKESETLEPEIREYEPKMALFDGGDGLDFYRRIVGESGDYLDGYLLLEIGSSQAAAVKDLIDSSDYLSYQRTQKDYAGCDRVIVGKKES